MVGFFRDHKVAKIENSACMITRERLVVEAYGLCRFCYLTEQRTTSGPRTFFLLKMVQQNSNEALSKSTERDLEVGILYIQNYCSLAHFPCAAFSC